MSLSIPIQAFQLHRFPAQIFREAQFAYRFCCTIQALKNQWLYLNYVTANQSNPDMGSLQGKSFSQKLQLLKTIAHKTSFISKTITYSKICKGHNIRINSRKIRKRKVDGYIEIMMKKFIPDQYAILNSLHLYKVSIQRRRRRFDVRASFKHPNNSPNCDAEVTKETILEEIITCEVLDQFENKAQSHNLNLQDLYETLFTLIF